MIVLVILAIYFFYTETRTVTISVRAFYKFENKHSLLEINSGDRDIKLFCIILTSEIEEKAIKLLTDTPVIVEGKCKGLAEGIFPNSIYIEVKSIK
jgi:hypothetical protein